MYKKSILSVAIASSLMLTGCFENNKLDDENAGVQTSAPVSSTSGSAYPAFSPAVSDLSIPNDLIFDAVAGDGTFLVPDSSPPVTTALNKLSGASTIAPIDIKILSGEVDEATLAGNVYLIELAYASGSPVQGLSIGEVPTVAGLANVAYEHLVLDGNSYIRINPKVALKPLTRYEVVITNGVKDTLGQPLVRNPGVASYAALSDLDIPLANPALAPVQTLINSFWEPTAVGFFDAVVNPSRIAADLDPLTESNIILSYTLTTSGDEKVLNYIADPAQWFNDQLTRFVGIQTATGLAAGKAVDSNDDGFVDSDLNVDGTVNYTDYSLAISAQIAAFPSAGVQAALTGVGLPLAVIQSVPGCGAVTNGAAYISCLSAILGSPSGPFGSLLPTPTDTTITFDDTNTLDAYEVSSLVASTLQASGVPFGTVSVVEGTLTIPYYNGLPSGSNGVPLITDSWEADDTLASAINSAFAPLGLAIPQADPLVTTAVNYIFPFPKKQDDVTIPILAIHPKNPAGAMKTVIYQHGITTDRSASLAFGSAMVAGAKLSAAQDVAIIAIDQPLHGIDGISPAQQAALAETLLTSGSILTSPDLTFDGIDADEQTTIDSVVDGSFVIGALLQIQGGGCPLGITDPSDSGQIAAAIATVESGVPCGAAPAAALLGAQTLVRTIANGASTIPGLGQGADSERHFGFTSAGAGVAPNAMDYTGSGTTNASGSLFINLTSFLTSRDNLRQQVLDLLAVRKSVGLIDLNPTTDLGPDLDASNVFFIGHSLGTINGMPFVAVANDSSTTDDDIVAANFLTPGGGITRLLENSPTFSPAILGGLAALGLTQDTSSFQTYMNVLQAALDSADPSNFVQDFAGTTPVLFTEVLGDVVIPNSVDTTAEVLGNGSVSFLAGTEPLAVESGATALTGSSALTQNIVRFTEGGHGTPAFPSTGTAEESAAFAEMVGQATSMVVTNGTAISVTNTAVIQP